MFDFGLMFEYAGLYLLFVVTDMKQSEVVSCGLACLKEGST